MEGIRLILEGIGEDPSREGLVETPLRIARMYQEVFAGMGQSAKEPLAKTFHSDRTDIVLEKDITFYSMCEHHILPFFGKVSIGYIPDGAMIGLSKLARVVNVFARRLQVQERLTAEICRAVGSTLNARGVIVVCTGEHLCMKMRGVEKQDSATTTVDYNGVFAEDPSLRQEFFAQL